MQQGLFLKSTALLDDTFFEKAVIFIAEHNENGDMGFVVNQPFSRTLNELAAFKHIRPFPLYIGGPVDQEHVYFVHRRPDIITGGTPVTDTIFLGGDFKAAVKNIDNNTLTEKDIKLFIGYCGWDGVELEDEVKEGSWEVIADGDAFEN